jgi:hypothetical protein
MGNAILIVIAALLSLVFRVYADALYGCFFVVALINALAPFVCNLERRLLYSSGVSR